MSEELFLFEEDNFSSSRKQQRRRNRIRYGQYTQITRLYLKDAYFQWQSSQVGKPGRERMSLEKNCLNCPPFIGRSSSNKFLTQQSLLPPCNACAAAFNCWGLHLLEVSCTMCNVQWRRRTGGQDWPGERQQGVFQTFEFGPSRDGATERQQRGAIKVAQAH